jgi:nitroreductase
MENKIIEALNFRYATKQYDSSKKIKKEDLEVLLEVLRLSPSSFGLEPWKFIVIESKELREKLREAAWGQPQITDASHIIVICARKDIDEKYISDFIDRTAKKRNIPRTQLLGFEKMLLDFRKDKTKEEINAWNVRQTYIALGLLLESAALKSIDSTPMEGFDKSKFDEILDLNDSDYQTSVVCALGYRSKEDNYMSLKKVRFDKKEIIEFR